MAVTLPRGNAVDNRSIGVLTLTRVGALAKPILNGPHSGYRVYYGL
jgi:hypothetical protein